jgi:predicted membrane protein
MKPLEHTMASDDLAEQWQKRKHRGRIAFGVVLVAIAALLILKELGLLTASWLLSWPMIFFAFGFISLVKNGFRHPFWIFMFGIGAFFLSGMLYPEFLIQKFILPAVLAFAGLLFIFRRKESCRGPQGMHRFRHGRKHFSTYQEISTTEDELHINNSYSGVKRSVISKDFKGGEIRNHLGACELNLMHAEIQTQATIVIDQHMGGIKLIVPSHWRIQSEVNCTMTSVEDQRNMMQTEGTEAKLLVLKGSSFMGGIEIVSY